MWEYEIFLIQLVQGLYQNGRFLVYTLDMQFVLDCFQNVELLLLYLIDWILSMASRYKDLSYRDGYGFIMLRGNENCQHP